MIVIVMPLLIVRGCSAPPEEVKKDDTLPIKKQQQEGIKIKVYMDSEKEVKTMYLEEYLKGVVAAEMPAEFGLEALKAQAVAARTYAVGRMQGLYKASDGSHDGADVCTSYAHCQAWISKQAAVKGWGIFNSYKYWKKIEKAVKETENQIVVYQGKIINPLFHSNSGGKTENSEDAWEGVAEPYLRSVVSSGEEDSKDYKSVTTITINDFCDKLKEKYPNFNINKKNIIDSIKVLEHTEGGRVKNIKVGNVTIKGTEFRTLFSLKSANFDIKEEGKDSLKITVIGYGHGVGLSQWGANYLAKTGGSYEEILKYYYKGVELQQIGN